MTKEWFPYHYDSKRVSSRNSEKLEKLLNSRMDPSRLCSYLHYRYCDPVEATASFGNATGTITPTDCPQGHFCPINTTSANSYPCPPGTYNNRTALETVDDCQSCEPGTYCQDSGKIHNENMSMLYMKIFSSVKIENFIGKNLDIFLIFAQNIDCGYMLKWPYRGGSNEYP